MTPKLLKTFAVPLLLLSAAAPSVAEDAADLVLRHGVFYPVVPAERVEGSLAVRGGRITYLGPDSELGERLGPRTEVIELGGRTVTPGLIDAHSHLASLGESLGQVALVGTTSYDEVIRRVAQAAAGRPPGEWIRGRGWDQNDWQVAAFPEHAALSRAVPDHPVWLTRIDGHAALVNARGLELLGIGEDAADPAGGRLLRDAEGRLTGVLIDAAMSAAGQRLPVPTAEERGRQLRLAAERCLSLGLTTVTEMGVTEEELEGYLRLAETGGLELRAALFIDGASPQLDEWLSAGPRFDPEARLLVRGVKLYADGALGSRGAALLEPYSDDAGNLGLLLTPGDELLGICRDALDRGFQVGIHAIGDRGGVVALDALEACLGGPAPERRMRLEHAQVLRPADIRRLAELGVIASMQPTHATSDMPWAEARVGPRRIQGAYAWRKILDAGGRLALGSDFPVESADPRLGLYAAVSRQDLEGNPAGGWLPGERLTPEEALRGFTLDAAYSLFLETEVGSLEVGKRADLVVFDRDIMRLPAAGIPGARVDLTMVDGEIVYRREAGR